MRQENHYKENQVLQVLCPKWSAGSLPTLVLNVFSSFAHTETFTVFHLVISFVQINSLLTPPLTSKSHQDSLSEKMHLWYMSDKQQLCCSKYHQFPHLFIAGRSNPKIRLELPKHNGNAISGTKEE